MNINERDDLNNESYTKKIERNQLINEKNTDFNKKYIRNSSQNNIIKNQPNNEFNKYDNNDSNNNNNNHKTNSFQINTDKDLRYIRIGNYTPSYQPKGPYSYKIGMNLNDYQSTNINTSRLSDSRLNPSLNNYIDNNNINLNINNSNTPPLHNISNNDNNIYYESQSQVKSYLSSIPYNTDNNNSDPAEPAEPSNP